MHDYRHTATPPRAEGPIWRRLAPGIAVGLVLAAGSAVSLAHLTARWQEQAPAREAARQLRAKLEAEQRAREAAERALPVAVAPPAAEPRDVREISVPTTLTYRAVEWVYEPSYTVSSDDLAPGFRDRRLDIEFRCTAGVDGRLHDCSAIERPAGSGLARAILPQLHRVRLRPMRIGDEAIETTVSFSLSFDFRSRGGSSTPRPQAGAAPPAPAIAPPQDASSRPSDLFTDPDPIEPVPVG